MEKKLYVGNISFDTTDETLKQAFSACGTVVSVGIIMDRDSGRSRGFGFVEMTTPEEAQKAIETLNDAELDGRKLKVNEAREREKGEKRSYGSSGGGGGGGGRGRRDRY